jgi:hypothetical protein
MEEIATSIPMGENCEAQNPKTSIEMEENCDLYTDGRELWSPKS